MFFIFLILIVVTLTVFLAIAPGTKPRPTLAQSGGSCAVSNYDVTNPTNWVFIGFGTAVPPCPCPPTEKTIGEYSPVGVFKQYFCAQPPPPPPNKPGIDAGPACLGGTSRTVTLQPVGGSTFQVEMSPGNVY